MGALREGGWRTVLRRLVCQWAVIVMRDAGVAGVVVLEGRLGQSSPVLWNALCGLMKARSEPRGQWGWITERTGVGAWDTKGFIHWISVMVAVAVAHDWISTYRSGRLRAKLFVWSDRNTMISAAGALELAC